MPQRVSSPEFVGRGPELAAMLGALERALDGKFAAVFAAGESGVGKSRLLRELTGAAEGRGARVLGGDCVSYSEGELPYGPVRSALRGLVRELDPASLEELLGPGRDELARLVPELGAPGPVAPAEWVTGEPVEQAALFELVAGVLARLAADAPLVLMIEDVHWADRSTLDFLSFLIGDARRQRLLLVCSYRTDALHPGNPLRAFVAQHESRPVVARIELHTFTREELREQLRGILGAEPEPALVRRMHERTEGNAFFTEELLAASSDASELPASLRDALLLRFEVLPRQAQQVLRMAATHGRVVPHRLLAAASELPEWELHEALREALAHHLLIRHDAERYAFRHALLQETVESDLLPGERAGLHLALAQALQDDPTLGSRDGRAAAALCVHWLGAQRLPEALGAAVRAGIEAEEVYAFAEATRHFQRALELWPRVEDAEDRAGIGEVELYARAADCALVSGEGPEAIRLMRTAIEKLDESANPVQAALLRERLGRYLFMGAGDTESAQTALQEAVDILPADEAGPELARVLATLAAILMLRGRTVESMELCQRAIEVARRAGAGTAEAHALNSQGVNLAAVGDRETGIQHLRDSSRMSDEQQDPYGLFRAYLNLSDVIDMDGRIEEAAEVALAGAVRAREWGMTSRALALEGRAAARLLKLGRMDEADRLTERALELPTSLAKLHHCAARAQLEVHRGRAAEAEAAIRAAQEATPSVAWANWMEPLASSRVELELLRGRPEDARLLAAQALELAAEHEQVFYTARLHALVARADALIAERCRAAGDEAGATEASARAQATVHRIARLLDPDAWRGSPPREAVLYHETCAAEGLRAVGTAAAPGWTALAGGWLELSMPLEAAYAHLREAECLLLAGERVPAETAVAQGFRLAKDAGAHWLHGELESLANRGRLPLPDGARVAVDGPIERLGLTERELAVLELVALGKTNREIGEQLFMAPKTASVHVSRILTKLEVSSRLEAATAAQRLGIVP